MALLLNRRALLGVAAACPLCLSAPAENAAGHPGAPPHWGYEGEVGPSHWGELSADFRTCAIGTQQTPIDLKDATRAQPGRLAIAYQKMPLRIINNGHTIQVNTPPGSWVEIGAKRYDLVQFHFHHPSEHLLSGKLFAMECHFVHTAADGTLAVLGVFVRPGAANQSLVPIWQAMPSSAGPETTVAGVTVDTAELLPKDRDYFRYMGSLTTPPCSEGITWTVFPAPVEASPEQIRRFAAVFPMNARPVQPLDGRSLLRAGRQAAG